TVHVSMPARTRASAGVAANAANARPANAISVFLDHLGSPAKTARAPKCEPQANSRYAREGYLPL
ncbi:MAG: hypothetical protein WB769_19925, partial [Pseudolabrys sp.]